MYRKSEIHPAVFFPDDLLRAEKAFPELFSIPGSSLKSLFDFVGRKSADPPDRAIVSFEDEGGGGAIVVEDDEGNPDAQTDQTGPVDDQRRKILIRNTADVVTEQLPPESNRVPEKKWPGSHIPPVAVLLEEGKQFSVENEHIQPAQGEGARKVFKYEVKHRIGTKHKAEGGPRVPMQVPGKSPKGASPVPVHEVLVQDEGIRPGNTQIDACFVVSANQSDYNSAIGLVLMPACSGDFTDG